MVAIKSKSFQIKTNKVVKVPTSQTSNTEHSVLDASCPSWISTA